MKQQALINFIKYWANDARKLSEQAQVSRKRRNELIKKLKAYDNSTNP